MHHTRHTVEVRHQAIAELVVGYDGLVGRMIGWSDVPHLTQRPLTVGTIERNETAKLVPASLQLTPLLQIGILLTGLVKLLLGSHIAVFYTETTLVHSPERKTCHGIVQSGSHLRTHILPAGSDVARPGSGAVALFASKARTGEEEDTLVRVHATLTIVDGVGIHDAVGIEILGSRTQGGRTGERLAVPHRRTVAHIRLRSIHPPGIDTELILGIEILIHLSPEHLSSSGIIGIIEGAAETEPVVDIILDSLVIHPALGIQFLVILHGIIELRPNRNHESSMQGMHTVEHRLRVRIACRLKLVASP